MPVISVVETQQVDLAGTLTDLFEITFTVPPRPGAFTFTVPKSGDPVADAARVKAQLEAEVEAIYAL